MAAPDDLRRLLGAGLALNEAMGRVVDRVLRDPDRRDERSGTAAPGKPGGAEERETRHEVEGALLSGLADALEARYRAKEAGERLEENAKSRAKDGFQDNDDKEHLGYDFAAFGMHTVKQFLELNARANRKVTRWLRTAHEGRAPRDGRREPSEQPAALIVLRPEYADHKRPTLLGDFEVMNRRAGRLCFDLPAEVTFRYGTVEETVSLDFVPRAVDVAGGEEQTIRVFAPRAPDFLKRSVHAARGLIVPGGSHGRHAPMPIEIRWSVTEATTDNGKATVPVPQEIMEDVAGAGAWFANQHVGSVEGGVVVLDPEHLSKDGLSLIRLERDGEPLVSMFVSSRGRHR